MVLLVEISYPAGAVRVIGPASALPLSVKDCEPEALPATVSKLPSEFAEDEIAATMATSMRKVRGALERPKLSVPTTETVALP